MSIYESSYACLNIISFIIGELASTQLYFIYNIRDNFKLYCEQKGKWKII